MQAMILAAWDGMRMHPYTRSIPKSMLPVAGAPTLAWILQWLRAYGITDAGINLRSRPEIVQNYFGEGADFGVHLTYSIEQTLLGTAGGVKRLSPMFKDTVVLVYGDVLTDLNLTDLIRFHFSRTGQPHVTVSLMHVSNPLECGIVDMQPNGRVKRFVEKPSPDGVFSNLANAGVIILDREIIGGIPDSAYCDIAYDLFPRLLIAGTPIYGWMLPEEAYLIDIGTPEKYRRVQTEWPTSAIVQLLASFQKDRITPQPLEIDATIPTRLTFSVGTLRPGKD